MACGSLEKAKHNHQVVCLCRAAVEGFSLPCSFDDVRVENDRVAEEITRMAKGSSLPSAVACRCIELAAVVPRRVANTCSVDSAT